jgi:hypothetical protein
LSEERRACHAASAFFCSHDSKVASSLDLPMFLWGGAVSMTR